MPGDDEAADMEADDLEERVQKSRSTAGIAERKRARIRAKEKRKKVKKAEKLRAKRQAEQAEKAAEKAAKRPPKRPDEEPPLPGSEVKRKRGRPKKIQPEAAPQTPQVPETPAAPEVLGAETPEIAGNLPERNLVSLNEDRVPDQALERITMPGTPETAAPRRPNLEVPMTPPEDLPQPGPSPLEDESFQVRLSQKAPLDGPAPPPCVTAFAALVRHVAYELPSSSSARDNAISKVARSLATTLGLPELNFLLREVQLEMMERSGLSRTARSKVFAADATKGPAFTLAWSLDKDLEQRDNVELQQVKAVCKTMVESGPFGQGLEEVQRFQRCSVFIIELLKVIESPESWQVAWQHLGLHQLSEEERDEFSLTMVTTMLALSASDDCSEQLSQALAALVRSHKIKLRVFIEAVNDAVGQIGESELLELMQVLSSLLAALYPAFTSNSRYGWCRPGWLFKDWMRMVETLLGNMEESCGVELLEQSLTLLEALPAGQVHSLTMLREVVDTAKQEFGPGDVADPQAQDNRQFEAKPRQRLPEQSCDILEIEDSPGEAT